MSEVFFALVHMVAGVIIIGGYIALAMLSRQWHPPGDTRRWAGPLFFLGCGAFHAAVMVVFIEVDLAPAAHAAIHLTEMAQLIGAPTWIVRASL